MIIVKAGICLLIVLVLISFATLLPGLHDATQGTLIYEVLQDSIYLLAAALVAARARHAVGRRAPWVLLAIGLTLYGLGNVVYYAIIQHLDPEPFPSASDALWLALYPLMYAAAVLLVRNQVREWHASQWLDGLVAALGAAALAVSFALAPVLEATSGTFAMVAVNLAYPVADMLLLMLVVLVFAVTGGRAGIRWWLLGIGMATFAVADATYMIQVANGTFAPGEWVDQVWLVGILAMTLAAWTRHTRVVVQAGTGMRLIAVPMLFACSSLALLLRDGLSPAAHPAIATWLSAATIAVALLRTALTFREVRSLADARRQARTDDLTGLANRRRLLEALDQALSRPGAGRSGAVLLLDLDRFKEVNDSFGHHVGDHLLRLLSLRLGGAIPSTGLLARMGGDEYGALLPGAAKDDATSLARGIRVLLEEPFHVDGLVLHIDASVGIALFPEHGTTAAALLRHADIAMYEAKRLRTGHAVFDEVRHGGARERMETLAELRTAIGTGQLVLHYQPKLHLPTGEVAGVEALVRWQHPTRGLLFPDAFLALAEQAGLMGRVTDVLVQQAVQDAQRWRQEFPRLTVAVNVSASNLQDLDLPNRVERWLAQGGLPAEALVLEITENVLIVDPERALEVLRRLRAVGVTLSVDDFGTGYCSLGYIRELPVQELKLDRSFVTDLLSDPRSGSIVRNTIDLTRQLDLAMVAEGVEDADTLEALRRWGCDLAQGYYLTGPLPGDLLLTWLRETRGTFGAVPSGTAPSGTPFNLLPRQPLRPESPAPRG